MKSFITGLKIIGGGLIPTLIRFEALWSLFNLTTSVATENNQNMEWMKLIEILALFLIGAFVTYKIITIERKMGLYEAVVLASVFKAIPDESQKGAHSFKSLADHWKADELIEARRGTKELLLRIRPNLTAAEAENLSASFFQKITEDFQRLASKE